MQSSDALIARFLALHPKSIDLSLGRTLGLLDKLGQPQNRLPPVIHVAGTNGKGSTIAFMRAILEAAGLSVHVYTSPHLVRFHERIRLGVKGGAAAGGGRFVEEAELVEALRHCEAVNAGAAITVFEITTAAAFHLFAQHHADVLLLEVGLGGRFDSSNVIPHPAASIVTPVSMDHAEYLGDTVEKIAFEKAGIFKRGAPAVIARQNIATSDVLAACAEKVGVSALMIGGQDFDVYEEGGRLIYQDIDGLMDLPLPRLTGRHQLDNAGTAIAGLRSAGYGPLPSHVFEQGVLHAQWPARLQRLKYGALVEIAPPGSELWLDGGHNADGARALAAAMADLHDKKPAPLVVITGILGTKDVVAVLGPFAGLAESLTAVPITGQMAGRPPQEIADMAMALGFKADVAGSVGEALRQISQSHRHKSGQPAPRILIFGSLYLAGEVLAANGTPPV